VPSFDAMLREWLTKGRCLKHCKLGMWPSSQEVVDELQRLHPRRVLPVPSAYTFSTTTFTQDDVLHAAMSFPRGSAAGTSGLRPSHLRESLQCRE